MNLPIVNIENQFEIRDACHQFGFFYVPIDDQTMAIVNQMMIESKNYFVQPLINKEKQLMTSNGLGYAPLGRFKLDRKTIELNESYVFRPTSMKSDIYQQYFDVVSKFGQRVFIKVIESLGLCTADYERSVNTGFNTLTLLHYPGFETQSLDTYGIAPHTDWGLITLLHTTAEGLQIKINDQWIEIPPLPNHFIVNIGNMLEIISNGQYRSTPHRVLSKTEKYSIAFFFEPHLDSIVKPYIESQKYQPVRYGDYMKEKLTYSFGDH